MIRSGSAWARVYRVVRSGGREVFTLAWYEGQVRRTQQFTDAEAALAEGRLKVELIAAGELEAARFSRSEREEYVAAVRLAGAVPLGSALREWRECRDLAGADVIAACRLWAANHGRGRNPHGVSVNEAVKRYLKSREASGFDVKAGAAKTFCVKRGEAAAHSFTAVFGERALREVSTDAIAKWLQAHHADPVSHNTHLKRIAALFRWCRRRGLLPASVITAPEQVDRAREVVDGPVVVMRAGVLAAVRDVIGEKMPEYLPALVLAAACGLRSGEVHGQRWQDIDLEGGRLWVSVAKPRTPQERQVPIAAGAVAWLRKAGVSKGPVCSNRSIDRIRKICRTAGLRLPENGFRKTWISARVEVTGDVRRTTMEGGTSAKQVHRHYRRPLPHEEALAWFAVWD